MGRLVLGDPKYAKALISMGISHGKGFDCMSEKCPVCKPFRERELEEWEGLGMGEKVTRGVIGIKKHD